MSPLGIVVLAGFLVAGYFYVGKPVAHEVKKAALKTKHAVVHVATLGKK